MGGRGETDLSSVWGFRAWGGGGEVGFRVAGFRDLLVQVEATQRVPAA